MGKLAEIGIELGLAQRRAKELELSIWKLEQDAVGRKVALVPESGWPGKNEAERNAARDRTYSEDETLLKIAEHYTAAKIEHNQLTARSLELEAQRRGLEWEIREQIAAGLKGRSDEVEGNVSEISAADVALDDVGF